MRRRSVIVAFALFAALLAVSAMPVGALQTNTAVGSIHTNASDFNAATTLTDVSVQGSGASADVELTTGNVTVDSFEDGGISEYTGDTGSFTVNSNAPVFDGSNSLKTTTNNVKIGSTSGLDHYPGRGDIINARVHGGGDANSGMGVLFGVQSISPTNFYRVDVQPHSSDFELLKFNSSPTVISSTNVAIPNNEWLRVRIRWQNDNTIIATLFNASGSQLAQISATDGEFATETGTGWSTAPSNGAPDAAFDFYQTKPITATEGTYISQTHTVDNAVTGFTNLTLTDAAAEVTWLADTDGDGTFETQAASSTFTTTGNHTLGISGTDSTDWRVNVTFINQSASGAPTAQLHDEGVLFTNHEPTVDNSSASPTGQLSADQPMLSIQVNDTEFGTAQGDSVDVEIFVDGNSVGTDTLASNGTASVSAGGLAGGDHTWHAVATDSYGLSNTSDTFSITMPANLTIRNETSPYNAITECTANVKFYEDVVTDPEIVERTDTDGDGNISLSGLPVGTEFVATVRCDGYHNRTVLIPSIFEQKSAFILNKSEPSVENRFTINDRTGEFSPGDGTQIVIQKAINRSKFGGSPSGFSWTNVAGDDIGADESFTTDLVIDDRYRIKVKNDDGDERILGSHVTSTTGTFTMTVGRVILDPVGTAQPTFEATRTNETGEPVRVTFEYNDSRSNTSTLWLHIYEYNNESNVLLANTSFSGPYGTFSNTEDVPAVDNETTWVVEFTAVRDNEENIHGRLIVGPQRSVLTDLPAWFVSIFFVGAIWMTAGLFSQLNGHIGGLVVAGLGAIFYFVNLVPNELGSGVMILSLITGAVIFIREQRRGGF